MKALFVSSKNEPDYLASCLWCGLQELLGEENVVDATDSPWLHRNSCLEKTVLAGEDGCPEIILNLSGWREGRTLHEVDSGFGVLVVHSCFRRDFDWDWLYRLEARLAPGCKVAYVEGWDAAHKVEPPQCRVDAYFRKEIDGSSYPMAPHHLGFALPPWWLSESDLTRLRPIDVLWVGNPDTCLPGQEVRLPMLGQVFRTRKSYRGVIATHRLGYGTYFDLMRQTKVALCPSAADLADSLRTMEAVACGAVPLFVGYPTRLRDPWFPPGSVYQCGPEAVAEHIDEALAHPEALERRRRLVVESARRDHTTKARAKQMLEVLGVRP